MKIRRLFIGILSILFVSSSLFSCALSQPDGSGDTPPSNPDTGDNTGGTTGDNTGNNSGDNTGGNTSGGNSDNDGDNKEKIYTVKEAINECNKVSNVNTFNCGVDETKTITIEGQVYGKLDMIKTKKAFGLDVSSPFKMFLADETGYIACSSKDVTGSFWAKQNKTANDVSKTFKVTGYVSLYLGQPELFVTSYIETQNKLDRQSYKAIAGEAISLDQYKTNVKNIKYNCAGHGYDGLYNINNLYCLAKSSNVYLFTNGEKIIKVIERGVSFSVGYSYNITGYVTMMNYSPALNAIYITRLTNEKVTIESDKITNITINNFRNFKTSQEDTTTRMDSYIDSLFSVYKSTVYVSSYCIDSCKYYMTVSDNFDTGKYLLSSRITAQKDKGMMDIENPEYWNKTESEITNYCPLAEYWDENQTVDIYYASWQLDYSSNYALKKIYILDL